MIQKAASMLTILVISDDLLIFLSTCQKIVKLSSKESGIKILFNLLLNRWDKCDKGLKCNKCHTTVERLYHPDKYKRIFCDVIIIRERLIMLYIEV